MKFEERLKTLEDARNKFINGELGASQLGMTFFYHMKILIDDARKLKDEYAKLIKTVPYETVEPKYLAEHRKILSDLDKDQP